MSNTGQACNSNKRMIVTEGIYDDFVAELARLATGLKPGNPAEEPDMNKWEVELAFKLKD